jgi:hypothetical protein
MLFFQYLQYAPRNWIRTHVVATPMCLSSLVACEKDLIMWLGAVWVRDASDCTAHSGRRAQSSTPGLKRYTFFLGCITATKGMPPWNSRHYQVLVKLWMRDFWSVYSLRKKTTIRAHAFQATFFKTSLVTSCSLSVWKIPTYSPTFVEHLKLH